MKTKRKILWISFGLMAFLLLAICALLLFALMTIASFDPNNTDFEHSIVVMISAAAVWFFYLKLRIPAILLFLGVCVTSVWLIVEYKAYGLRPGKYRSYLCKDYRFTAKELQSHSRKDRSRCFRRKTEEIPCFTTLFKIPNTPETQFLAACFADSRHPDKAPANVILQNPESETNLWNDWSIKQIELFRADDDAPDAVPAATSEERIFPS